MAHNAEPNVINDDIIRQCIQTESTVENLEEKRKHMDLREVRTLIFSFRNIRKIDNLLGMQNVTKLQLDNNMIDKIQNIGHMVNLTWLDLSFNNIEKIEGLETLTQLTDVSLFNNRISEISGLDAQKSLNVFSLGNNNVSSLENVMYLRRFQELRLVNLAGNPICKDPEYRPYVLAHIKNLKYLDYRLVDEASVITAKEQYQDELLEIVEKEELEEQREKNAQEKEAQLATLREANLDGVETLFEDMLAEDPEFARLRTVPDLTKALTDFKEKYVMHTEELKSAVLETVVKQKAERSDLEKALKKLMADMNGSSRDMVLAYEKKKKKVFRELRDDPGSAEARFSGPRAELTTLQNALLEKEVQTVEAISDLLTEFDRRYSEIVDANKASFTTYFGHVRDLENVYFDSVYAQAMNLLEKYATGDDVEELSDVARSLLQDKDTLLNAVQGSHDAHTSKIDALEDELVKRESGQYESWMNEKKSWSNQRNRDRISEIWGFVERVKNEIDEAIAEDEVNT